MYVTARVNLLLRHMAEHSKAFYHPAVKAVFYHLLVYL